MTNSTNNSGLYEDRVREVKEAEDVFFRSEHVDFLQISSSLHPEAKSAIVVHKPSRPSPILLFTYGWHMSVQRPAEDTSNPYPGFFYWSAGRERIRAIRCLRRTTICEE